MVNQTIKVYFFNEFNFYRDDELIAPKLWPRRKVQTLFKVLALARGQVFTQEQLIDLLFPDLDPDKARQNLYNRISELRNFLEPKREKRTSSQFILRAGEHEYSFAKDAPCWLDTEAFLELATAGHDMLQSQHWGQALNSFQQALDLYQDDFLIEDLYEEWTLPHREYFQQEHLKILQAMGECHFQMGSFDLATNAYTQALEKSPTDEALYRCLMEAYALDGKTPKAIEVFRDCEQILQKQFGIEPNTDTQKLYHKIKNAEMGEPEKAVFHNLPLATTAFIGRKKELKDLDTLIGTSESRILTLVGPGGIGKTRLSIQAALASLNKFKDGVYFVDLSAIDQFELIINSIASVVSFTFKGEQDPIAQLAAYFQNKKVLIVLDNFEHVIEGAETIAGLLEQSSQLHLLITSRTRLRLKGEATFEVPGLALNNNDDSSTDQQEALQLCMDCIQRVDPTFKLDHHTIPHLRKISDLVQGMPLAIELAMAWIRFLSIEEIAKEIESSANFLESDFRDLPERHQSLKAVFHSSWTLLSDQAQEGFMRLSVFRGGMTREASNEISGTNLSTLSMLINNSLLKRTKTGRFEFHELLRQFAEAQLEENEQIRLRGHHLDYYSKFATSANEKKQTPEQKNWLDKLDADYDNLRAALGWSIQSKQKDGTLSLVCDLSWYWNTRGLFKEGGSWINQALNLYDDPSSSLFAKGLLWKGTLSLYQGLYEVAQSCLEQSLSICKNNKDASGQAFALNGLGLIHHFQGDFSTALKFQEQSFEIRKMLGNKIDLAETYNNLAIIHHYRGNYTKAKNFHHQSYAIRKEVGDLNGIARSLGNLANIALDQGDIELAQKNYHACLEIGREIGDQRIITTSLGNIGEVFRSQKQYDKAKSYFKEKLTLDQNMRDRKAEASSHHSLGNVLSNLNDIELAFEHYQESLRMADEIGDKRMVLKNIMIYIKTIENHASATVLFGAYQTHHEQLEAGHSPDELKEIKKTKTHFIKSLGKDRFEQAYEKGAELSWKKMINTVLIPSD